VKQYGLFAISSLESNCQEKGDHDARAFTFYYGADKPLPAAAGTGMGQRPLPIPSTLSILSAIFGIRENSPRGAAGLFSGVLS
jgi:hypothetical protein